MNALCMMLHKSEEDWKAAQHSLVTIQMAATQSLANEP